MIKVEQLVRMEDMIKEEITGAVEQYKDYLKECFRRTYIKTVEEGLKAIKYFQEFNGKEYNEAEILAVVNKEEKVEETKIEAKAMVYENGVEFETKKSHQGIFNTGEFIAEFEGAEAINVWWWYQFNKLDDYKKELIRLIGNNVLTEDKTKTYLTDGRWIHPEILYKLCVDQLNINNLLKPCTRCGGTGHYSRNAQGSTTCYKCNGYKFGVPTKYTKKLIKQIKESNIKL